MNFRGIIENNVIMDNEEEAEPGFYFQIRATFVIGNNDGIYVDPAIIPKKTLDAMVGYLLSPNTWEEAFAGEIEVIDIVGTPNIDLTKKGIKINITLKLSSGDEDEIESWMEIWNDKGIWQTHFPTEINFNTNSGKKNNNLTVDGYKFLEIKGIKVEDITDSNQNGGGKRKHRRIRSVRRTRRTRRTRRSRTHKNSRKN
jgi:hypothetical protein